MAWGLLDCDPTFAVTVATILVAYYLYTVYYRKEERGPPCLPTLPFLGSVFHLPKPLDHNAFADMKQKYGDIFQFYLGKKCVVVLSSLELIREAFVEKADTFSNRPCSFMTSQVNPLLKGVLSPSPTDAWRHTRESSLSILRDFGFGRSLMEERIQAEVKAMTIIFAEHAGKPFDPRDTVHLSVLNVVTSILFNKRLVNDDERSLDLLDTIDDLEIRAWECQRIDLFPICRYLPRGKRTQGQVNEAMANLNSFLKQEIADHKDRTDPHDVDIDFVSAYMYKTGEENDSENLLQLLKDFYCGGLERTATVLRWALLRMGNQPEIMTKIQEEIDDKIGRTRTPCLSDRSKLVYMEAFILELYRHSSVVHGSHPHMAGENAELGGYFIPQDATIIANLRGVHMNENHWPNPGTFDVDRFLGDDGEVINKYKIIPFGIGMRSCMGESLARQQLFLFLTAILQKFDISPPPNMTTLREDAWAVGSILKPFDYEIMITNRD